jgi:hypothetical protein
MEMIDKTLVIGPWVGEFAFEVFLWQGYMRLKSKNYKRTVVHGLPRYKYLYEDFCDEFIDFPHNRSNSCMENIVYENCLSIENSEQFKSMVEKYSDDSLYDVVIPWKVWRRDYFERSNKPYVQGDQSFLPLGNEDESLRYDVVLHMRNRTEWAPERNWGLDNWKKLVQMLDGKYRIACVGSSHDHHVDGTDDYRNCDLKKEADLLRSSKVLVGNLSGGVQLGMLCGIHVITWFLETHRQGFDKNLNPLNNKSTYIPTFHKNIQPSPDHVFKVIEKALNKTE